MHVSHLFSLNINWDLVSESICKYVTISFLILLLFIILSYLMYSHNSKINGTPKGVYLHIIT